MANLTTAQAVASLAQCEAADVEQDWLDYADERIFMHLGYQYAGATISYLTYGDDGQYIRVPSPVATITSITEDGAALDATTYKLMPNLRMIRRTEGNLFFSRNYWNDQAAWYFDVEYVVTYVEPSESPASVKMVATQFVAAIVMFSKKYGQNGLATSASANASQSGGSLNTTFSYPPSLVAELDKIVRVGLPRQGV